MEIKDILQLTARYHGLSLDQLKRKTRKREIVQARQTGMVLCVEEAKFGLSVTGRESGGFDHATVLHAKKTINNLCDTDKYIRENVEYLRREVKQRIEAEKIAKKLKEASKCIFPEKDVCEFHGLFE